MRKAKTRRRVDFRESSTKPEDRWRDVLKEAETLQNRAERRRGLDAVPIYEAASALYKNVALDPMYKLTPEQLLTAEMGVASCLVEAAENLYAGTISNPDENLSKLEKNAIKRGTEMLGEACCLYASMLRACGITNGITCSTASASLERSGVIPAPPRMIGDNSPEDDVKVSLLVEKANVCVAKANLIHDSDRKLEESIMLASAIELYNMACKLTRDYTIYMNLGDALVSYIEIMSQIQSTFNPKPLFESAFSSFKIAATLIDPNLHMAVSGCLYHTSLAYLSYGRLYMNFESLQKGCKLVKESIELNKMDIKTYVALGELYLAMSDVSPTLDDKIGYLESAISEAFLIALRINRHSADGLVGVAEAHFAIGKYVHSEEKAAGHFHESYLAYKDALCRPTTLGSWNERCNVRYNFACVCSQALRLQEATEVLEYLIDQDFITDYDCQIDPDLHNVMMTGWDKSLLPSSTLASACNSSLTNFPFRSYDSDMESIGDTDDYEEKSKSA